MNNIRYLNTLVSCEKKLKTIKMLGENIKKYRELKGYSQEFMAHEMNISQSSYAKLENENTKITVERLHKIAELLEIEISALLDSNKKNVFNLYNNQTAMGLVEQYINTETKETYEKLIDQYEMRLKEKDQLIQMLMGK
ncbi:MAG: helix-turn-helix transcriptional regulator [Pseudarcicella sp.]|nr:helix-turn-helix transcriptional regulator [Pseudarcicella sp.]